MEEKFSPRVLRKARAKARLSQIELGKKAGVSSQQINRYENGRTIPRVVTVDILAEALEIDPDTLYTEVK